MLLFSTILDIEKSLTKDSFIKLVLEWCCAPLSLTFNGFDCLSRN